jgi:2-deoxy-D-gluconate 3-dehydrogenase
VQRVRELFDIRSSRIIITGGGSGIGAELAWGLAELGASVAATYHSRLEAPSGTYTVAGPKMYQMDLEGISRDDLQALWRFAEDSLGGSPNVLVNCAGINLREWMWDYSWEDWDQVLDVNASTIFKLAQFMAQDCKAREARAKIINISSLTSITGGRRCIAYTASKHAVAGLTKALAAELGPFGITVNAVAPGYIHTEMTNQLITDEALSAPFLARIPLGRWGSVADMVGPVAFLVSAASDYMTGTTLVVDGGYLSA